MAGNLDIVREVKIETRGFEKARNGLLVRSESISARIPLYTLRAIQHAERLMKEYAPVGDTGNLRRAIYSDYAPVPAKLQGGDRGWVGRAGIADRPRAYFLDRPYFSRGSFMIGKQPMNRLQDTPIEYAEAINKGRKEMNASAYGRKFFRWVNADGKQIFTRHLERREGTHFIDRAFAETDIYVRDVLAPEFASGIGKSRSARNELYMQHIGYNPFSRF